MRNTSRLHADRFPIPQVGKNLRAFCFVLFALTGISFGAASANSKPCSVPHYRRGYVWKGKPDFVMLNISMAIDDFAPTRLACLGEHLRKRYSGRNEVLGLIFDSHDAAKYYTHPLGGDSITPQPDWSAHEHASYHFDPEKNENAIYLTPVGNRAEFETKINLPVKSLPSCTLQMQGRCLLTMTKPQYPWETLKARAFGSVKVRWQIEKSGKLKDIAVISADSDPSAAKNALVEETLANLRTWRFEPSDKKTSAEVTYVYKIVERPGLGGTLQVDFDLPNQILIQGKPLR